MPVSQAVHNDYMFLFAIILVLNYAINMFMCDFIVQQIYLLCSSKHGRIQRRGGIPGFKLPPPSECLHTFFYIYLRYLYISI